MRREVFTEKNNKDFNNLCRENTGFRVSKEKTIKKHPFFKFMTHSRGNGKTIKEYWYDENTEHQEYYPYNVIWNNPSIILLVAGTVAGSVFDAVGISGGLEE